MEQVAFVAKEVMGLAAGFGVVAAKLLLGEASCAALATLRRQIRRQAPNTRPAGGIDGSRTQAVSKGARQIRLPYNEIWQALTTRGNAKRPFSFAD